jgi:hypothetical protein
VNALLPDCILLARQSPLENFAREFQGRQTRLESGYLLTGLLILLSILLAIWLLSRLLERFDGRRPVDSSTMLFLSLCKAHRLRWPEWWLLFRVAGEQKLNDPARLFLEPEWLDPANLPAGLRPRSARLEGLRRRLFAGLPDGDLPVPDPGDHDAEPPPQAADAGARRSSTCPAVPAGPSDPCVGGPPPATPASLPPATLG